MARTVLCIISSFPYHSSPILLSWLDGRHKYRVSCQIIIPDRFTAYSFNLWQHSALGYSELLPFVGLPLSSLPLHKSDRNCSDSKECKCSSRKRMGTNLVETHRFHHPPSCKFKLHDMMNLKFIFVALGNIHVYYRKLSYYGLVLQAPYHHATGLNPFLRPDLHFGADMMRWNAALRFTGRRSDQLFHQRTAGSHTVTRLLTRCHADGMNA